MWIRSQDKKRLLNASYIRANGNEIEAIHTTDYCTKIASYSTEAKAIKVLDMIEKNIRNNFTCKTDYKEQYTEHHRRELAVFQMPQDDEVKEDE